MNPVHDLITGLITRTRERKDAPMPAQTSDPVALSRRYLDAAAAHLKFAIDQPDSPFADAHTKIGREYRQMADVIGFFPNDTEVAGHLADADRLLREAVENPAPPVAAKRLSLAREVIGQAWSTGRANKMAARAEVRP